MIRLLYAVVLGLVGAGIVHIAILFMLPSFSERAVWTVLSGHADPYRFIRLDPADGQPLIRTLDPLFDAVACRFDLTDGVLHVAGDGSVPFWSMSIYDRMGNNIFSVSDRSTASPGRTDIVVATPAQLVGLRNQLPEAVEGTVFVEADIDEGLAVVRAFVPDESWQPAVDRYLDGLVCSSGR